MPKLIDVHTHAQFAAYDNDWKEVVDRSLAQNIWLVNVGTQRETSAKAIEIAGKYNEGVYATVGLHPIHTEKSHHDSQELGDNETATAFTSRGEEFDYDYYKKLGENPKIAAIGECGFDYYRLGGETRNRQTSAFVSQIKLAKELEKPLMVHCRQAFEDLIKALTERKNDLISPPGIIHFFSGTKEDAKKLLDLGFYFSFGGVITFVRDYDEVIKYIGLERIVLETDAPYVAPTPHRGKRNEPAYVSFVAEKLAEILNKDSEEIAKTTTRNARAVLKI